MIYCELLGRRDSEKQLSTNEILHETGCSYKTQRCTCTDRIAQHSILHITPYCTGAVCINIKPQSYSIQMLRIILSLNCSLHIGQIYQQTSLS